MQLFFYILTTDIITLCLGLFFLRNFTIPYKLVLFHVLLTSIIEIYGWYLGAIRGQHNVWLFNIFWLVGELWIMGTAGILLLKGKKIKQSLAILIFLATAFWGINIYQFGISAFTPSVLLSIYVVVLLIYFIVLFQSVLLSNEKIMRLPELWLCLSVILYFGCNIPYYGLFNYLNAQDPKLLSSLFNITLILNLVRYPMVAVSFFLLGKQGIAANKKTAS